MCLALQRAISQVRQQLYGGWHLPGGEGPVVMLLKHICLPFRSKMGLDKEPGLIHLETSISEGRE